MPLDGKGRWENPNAETSRFRYDEGPKDREWMEECDRNYIARLERNGCANQTEARDLTEWRQTHAAEYARGPRPLAAAADSKTERVDFVRAKFEREERERRAQEEQQRKEREAREAAERKAREKQQRKEHEAKEAEYQTELSSYSDLSGTSLFKALKSQASARLIPDLLSKFSIDKDSVNALDENGDSILHAATEAGSLELVKQLIAAGADVFLKNSLRKTAGDLAVALENKPIARALQIREEEISQSLKQSSGSKDSQGSGSTDLPSPPSSFGNSGGSVVAPPRAPASADSAQSWQIPPSDLQWDTKDASMHLGDGGFGTVYKGRYTQVKGFVAIKALHPFKASHASAEELRQEAAMMANLRSDFVVRFYGVCEWTSTNQTLLVMECCSHGSLYDYLHPQEKDPTATPPHLTWPVRYELARDISRGLDYLHRHQPMILHRDLKSLNVLLKTGESGELEAKLTDFGLAKMKNESSSKSKHTQSSVGTVPWMAPELLIEDEDDNLAPASCETDVYALGMVLFELASGQVPFSGKNLSQISMLLIQAKRPKIPQDTPKGYADLIQQCWAQRAKDRPLSSAVVNRTGELIAEPPQGAAAAEPLEHNTMLFSS